MAVKRFNMDDNFDDVNAYIEKPKEIQTQAKVAEPVVEHVMSIEEKKETSSATPDKLYRRNITLSEEQFWRLDYIKKRKNKVRGKDDELVTLDKLMYDMVQHCLDTQYASTKRKFDEHKANEIEDEDEDWV